MPGHQFAPEIEANERHGKPADVWGLGHLTNQLLNHFKSSSASEKLEALKELVSSMMLADQYARPTMKEVYTSLVKQYADL